MRKRITLFTLICLCFLVFPLAGCKNKEDYSTDSLNQSGKESLWSDENVDNDGWT